MFLADPAAPVDQQTQHLQLVIGDHRLQATDPDPDQGDRMGIGVVGLAALTGGEHPHPGRQLRWHIHHLLTSRQQPLGHMPPDPFTALDRPHPVGPLTGEGDQLGEPSNIGTEPAMPDDAFVGLHHLHGHRPLMRIHPDHNPPQHTH